MLRLLLPLVLIGASIGIFVMYTNPTYQNIQQLSAQSSAYDDALNKAQELRSVRDQLLTKSNNFSPSDLDKLQQVLPDNVDNIRLIININNIAARHGLSLSNVDLGNIGGKTTTPSDNGSIGSVDISFSVTTSNYDTFLAFVQDLEHSLRLIDITKLAFSAPSGTTAVTYAMSVRTYWLH